MTNGELGIQADDAEHTKVLGNTFNNIETVAVYVTEGDADVIGNTITDSSGGIIVDSLEKPTSAAQFSLVAGIDTGQPNGDSFGRV